MGRASCSHYLPLCSPSSGPPDRQPIALVHNPLGGRIYVDRAGLSIGQDDPSAQIGQGAAAHVTATIRYNNDFTEAQLRAPAVQERFESVAARLGGIFEQPVRVDLLRL